jgi:hypothetical protein
LLPLEFDLSVQAIVGAAALTDRPADLLPGADHDS